mmetsp:Transcript_23491/g.74903  ORF Transcript_23491/g.74903 Transcript_23491/m.74903 type:complete len:225 (-) Transcript_23491:271-945(-)
MNSRTCRIAVVAVVADTARRTLVGHGELEPVSCARGCSATRAPLLAASCVDLATAAVAGAAVDTAGVAAVDQRDAQSNGTDAGSVPEAGAAAAAAAARAGPRIRPAPQHWQTWIATHERARPARSSQSSACGEAHRAMWAQGTRPAQSPAAAVDGTVAAVAADHSAGRTGLLGRADGMLARFHFERLHARQWRGSESENRASIPVSTLTLLQGACSSQPQVRTS